MRGRFDSIAMLALLVTSFSLYAVGKPTSAPQKATSEARTVKLLSKENKTGLTVRGIQLGDSLSVLKAELPAEVNVKAEQLDGKRRIVLRDTYSGLALITTGSGQAERIESISVRPVTKWVSVEYGGRPLFFGDDTLSKVGKVSGMQPSPGGLSLVRGGDCLVTEFIADNLSGLALRPAK